MSEQNLAASLRSCKTGGGDHQPRRHTAALFKLRPDLARTRRRMAELGRLAFFRRQHGVEIGEPEAWARLIAEACAQTIFRREPDILDFEKRARSYGLTFDPDIAVEKLHAVCNDRTTRGKAWRAMGSERAARVLGVTADERTFLDIRTIGAIDETKAERAVRLAGERRERDRLRKRIARAESQRSRAERIAREVNAALSQKASTHLIEGNFSECGRKLRLAPWTGLGISRATWFRRRKAGLEAARKAEAEITALSETDLSSLQSESEKLTVRGWSQPEFVSGEAGYVCGDFEADRELRKAARRMLGRAPEPRLGEPSRDFCRRREQIDREIIATVGPARWRAMGALVLDGRLQVRTLARVLADAGLSSGGQRLAA